MTMEITPAQAQAFLDQNVDYNRPLRSSYITYLADCIKRGEWHLTHQGIALSTAGKLLDGQHRMHAIVKAGITVPMRVSFDVDPAAFIAMDRGRGRSDADVLNKDARLVGVARAIGQIPTAPTNAALSTAQISDILAWASGPIQMAFSVIKGNVKGRTSAPAVTACAVRCMTKDADYAMRAFGAFVNLDSEGMTPMVSSLLRQIERGEAIATQRWDFMARVWIVLDPARTSVTKVQLKSPTASIDEMKAVVKTYRERAMRKLNAKVA